jgi:hypothetical protein
MASNKSPINLPMTYTPPGTTSSSEYLHSGWTWEPEAMKMAVQLKVVEIGEIRQVITLYLKLFNKIKFLG